MIFILLPPLVAIPQNINLHYFYCKLIAGKWSSYKLDNPLNPIQLLRITHTRAERLNVWLDYFISVLCSSIHHGIQTDCCRLQQKVCIIVFSASSLYFTAFSTAVNPKWQRQDNLCVCEKEKQGAGRKKIKNLICVHRVFLYAQERKPMSLDVC